jgi:hypothetical protein
MPDAGLLDARYAALASEKAAHTSGEPHRARSNTALSA